MSTVKDQFLKTLRERLSNLSEERDRVWALEQRRKATVMLPSGQIVEKVRTVKLTLDCSAEGALLLDSGEVDRELIQIVVRFEVDSELDSEFVECIYFDDIPWLESLLRHLGIQK